MTIHFQMFQIMFIFHSNNNKMLDASIVTELVICNIIILIFIHVSIVRKPLIIKTNASKKILLYEQRFIVDGSLQEMGSNNQEDILVTCQKFL